MAGEQADECELIVIGGGPGGYAAAFDAADRGMDVTLINAEPGIPASPVSSSADVFGSPTFVNVNFGCTCSSELYVPPLQCVLTAVIVPGGGVTADSPTTASQPSGFCPPLKVTIIGAIKNRIWTKSDGS